ncbi:MAG: aldo/keto reductase [Spirochaetota bacterium]|nr:MAG: aldo/keto reductase [Spirochaetota bacterium]
MQFRILGRTGQKVSCIGFGGIPIISVNEKEAWHVLNTALDYGINFIDTARGYRESEELIGKSISERREEYFLATKTRGKDEAEVLQEYEKSIGYLKTDIIDLYQIHYINTLDELAHIMKKGSVLDTLRRLQAEGVVRYVGITGHDAEVLLSAARTEEFDAVQGAFSYVEKGKSVNDLIQYCDQNNIGFIVQKPLSGGAISCATAGLRWILGHPVSVVIPGMFTVEQVAENVKAGEGGFELTVEEHRELETIASKLTDNYCRRCNYCHPVCPQNLRIGVILEFYGKGKLPETFALMKRLYNGLEMHASDCTECGLCLPECPYSLPIVDMLKEAHELLK